MGYGRGLGVGVRGYLLAICLILVLMAAYVALLPLVAWSDGATDMTVSVSG